MDIKEIPYEEAPRDEIPVKTYRPKAEIKEYEVPKVELSRNIQKFDKKPRVFTENPYSHNSISLKAKKVDVTPTQSASELLTNPLYNKMGKFLGVDTIHDWNRYYDKIYAITEWAKARSGDKDLGKLMKWVTTASKRIPNMGMKEIDSLYLQARMYLNK